jgi:hypothetical protein
MWWLLVLLAAVIAAASFFLRGRGPVALPRFLRRTALTFLCVFTAFIGVFVAGETVAGPEGPRDSHLVAVWLLVALPAGLLGWRRPVVGGVLLLVLGLAPVAVFVSGAGFGAESLVAVSAPPVLAGLLYLFAEIIQRRAARPAADAAGGHAAGHEPASAAPAGDADGPGQHATGAGGTRRDTPGQGLPRRAA